MRMNPATRIIPTVVLGALVVLGACGGDDPAIEYNKEMMPELAVSSYIEEVELLIGTPGVAQPLEPSGIPQHPFLAPTGQAGMHGDVTASGTHPAAGPLGNSPVIRSAKMGDLAGECAAVVFDSAGRLFAVCSDFFEMALYAMDPDDLGVLAKHVLPLRESHSGGDLAEIMNDTSGGAYFHLDDQDRPILANAERMVQRFVLEPQGTKLVWRVETEWDLNPHLPEGARITTIIPDWEGALWFVTRLGVVGVLDPESGDVHTLQLVDEELQNALTVGPDGVFIVSDHALYRFERDAGGRPCTPGGRPTTVARPPSPGPSTRAQAPRPRSWARIWWPSATTPTRGSTSSSIIGSMTTWAIAWCVSCRCSSRISASQTTLLSAMATA